MKLLKLVIVDDEPILLQGLLNTYEWEKMGFQVVGTAQSGEQAIKVIEEVKPHVVLTDIRMKQITGLMVMEEIQKTDLECLFIVLSAYRDFDYAQQACDLGAFSYLLKPIEDEKLQETMQSAYKVCMERIENEAKYESWEKLLVKDRDSFLQVVIQKYVQNRISQEKMEEVMRMLDDLPGKEERFITVFVDIDIDPFFGDRETLRDGADNTQIRLMRDDPCHIFGFDSGFLHGVAAGADHSVDRQFESLLSIHFDIVLALFHGIVRRRHC